MGELAGLVGEFGIFGTVVGVLFFLAVILTGCCPSWSIEVILREHAAKVDSDEQPKLQAVIYCGVWSFDLCLTPSYV